MSNQLHSFKENQAQTAAKYRRFVANRFMLNVFMLQKLPMGLIAGLRVRHLDERSCQVSVPYRWINTNPFSSTYFAVLAMAAEMSTGMLALSATWRSKPSVAMLVTGLEAEFVKKATGLTTFTCEDGEAIFKVVDQAVLTGEGQTFQSITTGRSASGEVEARFKITWSFKVRKN